MGKHNFLYHSLKIETLPQMNGEHISVKVFDTEEEGKARSMVHAGKSSPQSKIPSLQPWGKFQMKTCP